MPVIYHDHCVREDGRWYFRSRKLAGVLGEGHRRSGRYWVTVQPPSTGSSTPLM
jgi:hypothetical protein